METWRVVATCYGKIWSGEACQGERPVRIKVWKPGDSWGGPRVHLGELQAVQRAELAGWSLSAGSAPVLATGIDRPAWEQLSRESPHLV